MVWYVPPLSPVMSMVEGEGSAADPDDVFPAIEEARVNRRQLLSYLLQYPDRELYEAQPELVRAASGEPVLERFVAQRGSRTPESLEREYVEAFDFDRRASLHLTYHTHGDSRARGLALVRLKRRYREAGFSLAGSELPDYLPVLLEFAALEPDLGDALLNEHRASLELIGSRLHERASAYAVLLDAVVAGLPRPTKAQLDAARRIAEEGPPAELVGLEPFAAGTVP